MPAGDLTHRDWPWLVVTLVLSAVVFVTLAVWSALTCATSLPGEGGCVTNKFGLLLWTVLSLISVVGSAVQLVRLHPRLHATRHQVGS